jgi:hypothetical protein
MAPHVMPANAGIHDFLCCDERKSWMPAFAGMTWGMARIPVLAHMEWLSDKWVDA